MNKISSLCLITFFTAFNIASNAESHKNHDDEHEQHGAHDHARATIEVVKEKQDLTVDILVPADITTNFDLETKSLSEHAANATWMQITPKDACSLQEIDAHIDGEHGHEEDEHGHEEEHKDEYGHEGEHTDLHVKMEYQCSDIKNITFNIFDFYPELEEVEVLFVDETKTQKYHLTNDKADVSF